MSPQCSVCGQETVFIPQYQQWYCPRCQRYLLMQPSAPMYYPPMQYYGPQYYAPQAPPQAEPQQPAQPPVTGPTHQTASHRIKASLSMRQSSDELISTKWVWAIMLFQIVFPLSAAIMLYAMLTDTSVTLTNMGFLLALILTVLLLSIGLAASHSYLIYRLIRRRDSHIGRDSILMEGMSEYLDAVSLKTRIDLNVERWTMTTIRLGNFGVPRSASLWAALTALIGVIPFVGIFFLIYSLMFLTKDVHEHDERQRALNAQFRQGLVKAGKASEPSPAWLPLPRRDAATYIILTILSVGLFLPYWWYVNIQDLNTHMKNQWAFEESLVKALQADG